MTYAGDISPKQAWDMLAQDKAAVLVDVRTRPEWSFVGIPDLGSLGKQVVLLSWQVYPEMKVDADFIAKLRAQLPGGPEAPVLFLCRSGARSRSAAQALTAAGYSRCYNVSEGFEGDKDGNSHRGRRGGWKHASLPWVQD
ncbi:MAG TPA: rhodanese-like domain-containing protein [Dongiaceae bacterium]|jgi:rhodanese-related sulfurtransferase|nr:rhodanese-like domain-containing protein [Dongiaceae bacterium]